MEIINHQNNKPIVDTMLSIAQSVLPENNGIGTDTKLGKSILTEIYRRKQLTISKEQKLEVAPLIIKPTFNSILSIIDVSKQTEAMTSCSLSVVNNHTVDAVRGKLQKEIYMYKNNTLKLIKRYAYKVDAYIRAGNKEVSGNDYFTIHIINKENLCDSLEEKNYLTSMMLPVVDSSSKKFNIELMDINKQLDDLELNIIVQETIKNIGGETFYDIINAFTNMQNLSDMDMFIQSVTLKDINALAVINAVFTDFVKLNGNKYNHVLVLNMLRDSLSQKIREYDMGTVTGRVVTNYIRSQGDDTLIYVLDTNYKRFLSEGGSNKAIYGYVVNTFDDIVKAPNVLMTIAPNIKDLKENKERYTYRYKNFMDNIILTTKNKNHTNMINYYIFALDVVLSPEKLNKYQTEVSEYVSKLGLGELINTKETALAIFREIIMEDTNFNEFMKGFDEAEQILTGDDIDTYVTYASYRLVLLYLTIQTTLV